MTLKYGYTVPYEEITEQIVIHRYYAFQRWCEKNANSSYHVNPSYSSDGITVKFEDEDDCSAFITFLAGEYWIFLHN